VRLKITDPSTGLTWSWTAKTKRGFNQRQRKEIAAAHKFLDDKRQLSERAKNPSSLSKATFTSTGPTTDGPASGDPTEGLSRSAVEHALAKFKDANHMVVENFVFSAPQDPAVNRFNLTYDAALYKWNEHTQRAIIEALDILGK
jgi:hypothetical protein